MTRTTIFTTTWWGSRWAHLLNRLLRQPGLILALVPFLLSCEDDNFLSLPADPSQENLEILSRRIPVSFKMVRFDSLVTSPNQLDSKKLLAGTFQDNEFGATTAVSYLNFNVGQRTTVGDTATYESLELELLYERSYGAPSAASNQVLDIRVLSQQLLGFDTVQYYFNSDALSLNESAIGEGSISTQFTGEADTLRFRLDDALGQEIFNLAQAKDSTVISDSLFREFLPGIALTPRTNGLINTFNPGRTRLVLNFTDASGTLKQYTFIIRRFFNRITPDFSGTALTGLSTSNNGVVADDGNLYLQSGTAVAPRLELDSLLAFARSQNAGQQSIRLNRVDFKVGLRSAQDTLNAPKTLRIYELVPEDSLGFLRPFPQTSQGQLLGYLGVASNQRTLAPASAIPLEGTQYSLPISQYLSSVVDRDTLDQRLYLWADDFDASLSQLVTSGDSIYLDVNYTVLTLTDPE